MPYTWTLEDLHDEAGCGLLGKDEARCPYCGKTREELGQK